MTEPVTAPAGTPAELDKSKPYLHIRDRERPNVEYQQGAAYYDRKGHFTEVAAIPVYFPEPKKPEVRERTITQRIVGRTAKTVVGTISETVARAMGDKPSVQAEVTAKKRLGRPPKSAMPDPVVKAAKENVRAAAAEQAA